MKTGLVSICPCQKLFKANHHSKGTKNWNNEIPKQSTQQHVGVSAKLWCVLKTSHSAKCALNGRTHRDGEQAIQKSLGL